MAKTAKKTTKKAAPKKKSAPAQKKATAPQKAAAKAAAVKKPKLTRFQATTAAEALRALALAYAEARAVLPPEATDKVKAAFTVAMNPPAREADLAAAERASGILFLADYRALLAAIDGARFAGDLAVLGTADWIGSSELIKKGRAFIAGAVANGKEALRGCVPIANLGQPNDWLVYSTVTGRYLYCLDADVLELPDLLAALSRKAKLTMQQLAEG